MASFRIGHHWYCQWLLQVKLSVQKEIQEGAVLQQEFIIEFVVTSQMCDDCHRIEAKDYWSAVVQVRVSGAHHLVSFLMHFISPAIAFRVCFAVNVLKGLVRTG